MSAYRIVCNDGFVGEHDPGPDPLRALAAHDRFTACSPHSLQRLDGVAWATVEPRTPRGVDAANLNRRARQDCPLDACKTCTACEHGQHGNCRQTITCPDDQQARTCRCCGDT